MRGIKVPKPPWSKGGHRPSIPNPEDAARKAVERVIEPAVRKAKEGLEGATRRSRENIERAATGAQTTIQAAARSAEEGISNATSESVDVLRTTGHQIEDGFSDSLPKLLDSLADDLQAVIGGKIGDVLFGIVHAIAPGKAKVGIGFFEFEFEVKDKVGPLRTWLEQGFDSSQDVLRMVQQLTDDDTIILRPAKIPGLPYLGIDPRIPVRVEAIPGIIDTIAEKLSDIL